MMQRVGKIDKRTDNDHDDLIHAGWTPEELEDYKDGFKVCFP